MKKFTSMVLALCMVFSLFVPASATNIQSDESGDEGVISFDMEKAVKTGTQEFSYIDENGQEATVGIRFIPKTTPYKVEVGSYDNPVGEWEIYHHTIMYHVNYFIMIENNRITDAYDLAYAFIGPVCDSHSLTYSSKKASAYFTFKTPIWEFGSWNGFLNAEISGNTLKVIVE